MCGPSVPPAAPTLPFVRDEDRERVRLEFVARVERVAGAFHATEGNPIPTWFRTWDGARARPSGDATAFDLEGAGSAEWWEPSLRALPGDEVEAPWDELRRWKDVFRSELAALLGVHATYGDVGLADADLFAANALAGRLLVSLLDNRPGHSMTQNV